MIQIISTEKRIPILSLNETNEFIQEIDFACIEANFDKLKNTLIKFNIINHPEAEDFLSQGQEMLKKFNNPDESITVASVSKRKSKCIACSFGKTVTVYDISYKKQNFLFSISYISSFATNLDIKNGLLIDFAWCNAYLSKNEMKELTKI